VKAKASNSKFSSKTQQALSAILNWRRKKRNWLGPRKLKRKKKVPLREESRRTEAKRRERMQCLVKPSKT